MSISVNEILAEAVSAASAESRLIDDLELTDLFAEQESEEYSNSLIRQSLADLNSDGQSPVRVLSGKERLRCYDEKIMSDSYAEALNFAAEGDNLRTIAETVRKESGLYPRPSRIDMFLDPPYRLESGQLEAAMEALVADNDQFKDIFRTKASNGDVYLYSEKYLSRARAEYLAEWESVGSMESQ